MADKKYMDDLKQEAQTLAKLLREKDDLDVRIARQRKRVSALAELCDESEFGDKPFDFDLGGLADVCRTAMRASRKEWMTIAEIQAAIKELGYPLEKYKAPAASITTTVNRMVETEEVAIDKRPIPGANEYKYVGLGAKVGRELIESLRRATEALNKVSSRPGTGMPTVWQRVVRGLRTAQDKPAPHTKKSALFGER